MKKGFLFSVLLLAAAAGYAQVTVSTNNSQIYNSSNNRLPVVGGRPVDNTREIALTEGSKFFQDEWQKTKPISQQGAAYEEISVRLNLMDNKVHYKDQSGKEQIVGSALGELIFPQTATGKTVHFIHGSLLPTKDEAWYQLLVNDRLTLVKGFKKTLEEHTSYGSAPDYSIKTVESYYIFYKDQKTEVRKAADLVKIVPEKKAEIDAFIKKSSDLSREDLLVAATTYANTLWK